jgi:hypothetical protein
VLEASGYRVRRVGPTMSVAELGGRIRAEWLEALIGFAPARGPFQHVVIDLEVPEVEAGGGSALRLTCRNGFRQVGAPARIAGLVREIAAELGRDTGPVAVSPWRTNPPWEPAWSVDAT